MSAIADGTTESGDEQKKPQFGERFLTSESDVFEHNAWDNVEISPEQEEEALKKIAANTSVLVPEEQRKALLDQASDHWDSFYKVHENRFFKNRQWLFTEFPELKQSAAALSGGTDAPSPTESDGNQPADFPGASSKRRILEVGCGVGDTIFPILEGDPDPSLFVYGCDFADSAIELVTTHSRYDQERARCHAFVADISKPAELNFPFPEGSVDFILCIFVLSALDPAVLPDVVSKLTAYLKPGGMFLLRDYGYCDMAQLRFKPGQCLADNFYHRGDRTLVHFFSQDELRRLFTEAGLVEKQNHVDRRLQVNRAKKTKMYRIWIQCKYQKPSS